MWQLLSGMKKGELLQENPILDKLIDDSLLLLMLTIYGLCIEGLITKFTRRSEIKDRSGLHVCNTCIKEV